MLFELPVPRFLQVAGEIGIIPAKPGDFPTSCPENSATFSQKCRRWASSSRPFRGASPSMARKWSAVNSKNIG